MSDNNSNVFKCGNDVYTDKEVLEGAIAELLSAHLATLGLDSVQCGEKALKVRVDITVLTGKGRPAGSKNRAKDDSAPRLTGTHYVAERCDGTMFYHHVDQSLDNILRVWEFRTKDGAAYALAHNTVKERPCAWEAPVAAAAE